MENYSRQSASTAYSSPPSGPIQDALLAGIPPEELSLYRTTGFSDSNILVLSASGVSALDAQGYFACGISSPSSIVYLRDNQVSTDDVDGYLRSGISTPEAMVELRQGNPPVRGFQAVYLHLSGIHDPLGMREVLRLCQANGAALHDILNCREKLNDGVLGVLSPRLLDAHPAPVTIFGLLYWKTDLIEVVNSLSDDQLRSVVRLAEDNQSLSSDDLLALIAVVS